MRPTFRPIFVGKPLAGMLLMLMITTVSFPWELRLRKKNKGVGFVEDVV